MAEEGANDEKKRIPLREHFRFRPAGKILRKKLGVLREKKKKKTKKRQKKNISKLTAWEFNGVVSYLVEWQVENVVFRWFRWMESSQLLVQKFAPVRVGQRPGCPPAYKISTIHFFYYSNQGLMLLPFSFGK